jgi:hypothetical protein
MPNRDRRVKKVFASVAVLGALALGTLASWACTRTVAPERTVPPTSAVETAPPLPKAEGGAVCSLPEQPKGLVMTVTHSFLPMGAVPPHSETGSIASDGDCAGQSLCRVVSASALMAVLARVRPALAVHHEAGSGSPHYGGRTIELHFAGGQCEIGDSSLGAVTTADMPVFDAAFDAIVAAYAPPDAGTPRR